MFIIIIINIMMDLYSSVSIATYNGLDGPEIESRWRAIFSVPLQTDTEAHPASYTMGTGVFPGGKAAGTWRCPPTPSSSEVKDRVELYLYFPFWPSWPFQGRTLIYYYYYYYYVSKNLPYL
jgi:hypothetical protein